MIVVSMDAFQSIPFAYLRYMKRPIKFAALKLLFIFLNITLNLVYYVWMKGDDVAYAFLFNLVCTSVVMVCMIPELRGFTYVLDKKLLKRMLAYSLPLLILGIAGILNQVADKIICVKGDRIAHYGKPETIFKEDIIRDLYGIDNGYFDPVFGSLELPRPEGKPRVLVISSGGTGIPVYRELQK